MERVRRGELPDDWAGIALRWWLADTATKLAYGPYDKAGSRYRRYKRQVRERNLV